MYHGFARSAGFNFWESAGYTFAGSAFWEIAGETTQPSRNDQVASGIGGTFLGEALFRMSNLLLEQGGGMSRPWREAAAALISPSTGFNRLVFADRYGGIFSSHDAAYYSRLQLGYVHSLREETGITSTKFQPNEAQVDFSLDYGLPGKSGYQYTRPFDYFNFQATASSANGFENVLTRGLLVGKSYEAGPDYRGVWGIYGNYDYISPQTFRISTTGLSLGTTGHWWIDKDLSLEGTALAGLGYSAVGTAHSAASDRDYNYGVTPQALLALRLTHSDKASLDVTGREYFVSKRRLGNERRPRQHRCASTPRSRCASTASTRSRSATSATAATPASTARRPASRCATPSASSIPCSARIASARSTGADVLASPRGGTAQGTSLPLARCRRRSQRSARLSSWVTSTSAMPRRRVRSSISANTASALPRSRLPVGSSARTQSGVPASERAIATRWRSPPESCDGRCCSRSPRPTWAERFGGARARLGGGEAADAQRHGDVVERRELGQQMVELVDEAEMAVAPFALLGRVEGGEVAAAEIDATFGRRLEAAEQMQQRALARPRRADDRRAPRRAGPRGRRRAARGRRSATRRCLR